jgi:hypothetical protein
MIYLSLQEIQSVYDHRGGNMSECSLISVYLKLLFTAFFWGGTFIAAAW